MTTESGSEGPVTAEVIGEQISAWLDDELPTAEIEMFAARVAQSPQYRARLARYGLIGGSLRGGTGTAMIALALNQRVRAVLDRETDAATMADPAGAVAAVATRARLAAPAWLPYALAAGLAVIAVLLVPILQPPAPAARASPAAQASVERQVAVASQPVRRSAEELVRTDQLVSLSSNRLTNYLVYHGEYSGMLSAKISDSHIVNHRPYAAAVDVVESVPVR